MFLGNMYVPNIHKWQEERKDPSSVFIYRIYLSTASISPLLAAMYAKILSIFLLLLSV